jgi:hypothetical protein
MREKLVSALTGIVYVAVAGILIAGFFYSEWAPSATPSTKPVQLVDMQTEQKQAEAVIVCHEEAIPVTTTYTQDSSSSTTRTIDGTEGVVNVCVKAGQEVSRNVVTAMVPTQVVQGTYTPPVQTYRTGAICMDGSRSYATGRGACSWHGGVSEWLYNR